MTGFSVFLRKELREQWRSYKLLVVGMIFLFFGLLSPLTAKYLPEILKSAAGSIQIIVPPPTAADAVDQLIKNISQIGIFAAILVTMGVVAREKERGTAALVLTKPVTRSAFLAAKFIGLLATLAASITLAGIAAYGYTAILFESLPVAGYAAGCALLLLALLVYASFTFLGSTLVRSSLPAAGIGLAAFLLLAIAGVIPEVGSYTPGALYGTAHALALGRPVDDLWTPLLANLGLIATALLLAWLSFSRQEL
ncbi:MAG: ABC transporter permease [Herpetosiphonaceae bacterium]|nr:MAG: ABC transporter permease [Herpetosiphonaceae bacterium]